LKGDELTVVGKRMARLPVHPRLGRLLIEGEALGCMPRAALAAALLSERDPVLRGTAPASTSVLSQSDVLDRAEALEEFERMGRFQFPIGELHRGGADFVLRARDQLLRLQDSSVSPQRKQESADDGLLRSLLAAFPDRLARRRNPASPRGIMVGGRGVKLMPSSRVVEPEFFLCIDVDAGDSEALVRLASGVRREWLPAERIVESQRVEFNSHSEKVEAKRFIHFEDLLLDSTPILLPDVEATAPVLAAAALANWERIRPANDSPAGQYLQRLRSLSKWMPDLGLPAFDESAMCELLGSLCASCRSFDDLRKADWLGAIRDRLTYQQTTIVDREAPERIQVPSGSQIALTYGEGRSPVLAVRIQELFGLADTPRIAGGRVKVLLHLLAPNFRPQQVTDDLASFWANTYPTVRKDLRARYPKHAWPQDPLAAEATRGRKH
jgi:ATP-dependent helicase HrpB